MPALSEAADAGNADDALGIDGSDAGVAGIVGGGLAVTAGLAGVSSGFLLHPASTSGPHTASAKAPRKNADDPIPR
jgi:hypothetical protein